MGKKKQSLSDAKDLGDEIKDALEKIFKKHDLRDVIISYALSGWNPEIEDNNSVSFGANTILNTEHKTIDEATADELTRLTSSIFVVSKGLKQNIDHNKNQVARLLKETVFDGDVKKASKKSKRGLASLLKMLDKKI